MKPGRRTRNLFPTPIIGEVVPLWSSEAMGIRYRTLGQSNVTVGGEPAVVREREVVWIEDSEARKTSSTAEIAARRGSDRRTVEEERSRSVVASAKLTLQERYRMANLRTAAMLFVVTAVFVIAFLPASLISLGVMPHQIFVFYLYFVNNVANPFIYSFMNKNF